MDETLSDIIIVPSVRHFLRETSGFYKELTTGTYSSYDANVLNIVSACTLYKYEYVQQLKLNRLPYSLPMD